MGRRLRSDNQHQAAGRPHLVLPVRVRAGVLRVPDRAGRRGHLPAEDVRDQRAGAEDSDFGSGAALVDLQYAKFKLGSISFMNVLIEDDKKYIATYPIFLFYLFIDWFTLFI